MNVKELVEKYEITLYGKDKVQLKQVTLLKKDKMEKVVMERKPEIMAYLKEEEVQKKRSYEDRQEKIRAIEGLEEIQNAMREQIRWQRDFEISMSRGDGILPSKPIDNIDELKRKYPRAAAYLIAERESLKNNFELSAIGKKALEAIINGEDYEAAMNRMMEEQKKFVDCHIWD